MILYELAQAPAYLGTPTKEQLKAAEEIVGAVIEDEKNTENHIFGIAASSGIATGPVKIFELFFCRGAEVGRGLG